MLLFGLKSTLILIHSYLNSVVLSHLILLTCCHHEAEEIAYMWLQVARNSSLGVFPVVLIRTHLIVSFTYIRTRLQHRGKNNLGSLLISENPEE